MEPFGLGRKRTELMRYGSCCADCGGRREDISGAECGKGMLEIPTEVYGTRKGENAGKCFRASRRLHMRIRMEPQIVFDTDYLGQARSGQPAAGPMEGLKEGMNRILVWGE